jgi:hypothetical protein
MSEDMSESDKGLLIIAIIIPATVLVLWFLCCLIHLPELCVKCCKNCDNENRLAAQRRLTHAIQQTGQENIQQPVQQPVQEMKNTSEIGQIEMV